MPTTRLKLKDMVTIITGATDSTMPRMEAFKATKATGRLVISWETFKRVWPLCWRPVHD